MKYRPRVTGLLILLFAITYIDRVCISVAGPRMQADLGIDPIGWGWVTAMFTLSYCLFEIPTGALGDHIGPRRVLTRVVLWWSAFTSLTGAVSNYYLLLITRFCFGAGEAGAFPNASIVVSRWYPPSQRASMSGVLLMASQIGGAIAPLVVVPIQIRYGWRASFIVFADPHRCDGGRAERGAACVFHVPGMVPVDVREIAKHLEPLQLGPLLLRSGEAVEVLPVDRGAVRHPVRRAIERLVSHGASPRRAA